MQRRLGAVGAGVALVEIAADERTDAPAKTTRLVALVRFFLRVFFFALLVAGFLVGVERLVGEILFLLAPDRLRAFLPDRLHEIHALLAQDALHAANGIALAVKEMTDAAQEVDVVGPIVAASAA